MRLSQKQVDSIMRNPAIRSQLAAVGQQVAARARAITESEGGSANISIESGIRPGGRSFTNVESDSAEEEYGSQKKTRRRALGRAIRER